MEDYISKLKQFSKLDFQSKQEDKLCLPHHILEEKGLVKVSITVQALVNKASSKHNLL